MLVPVFERFAEFGWQLFVEPAETYEFFTVSGVFKRAHIDAKLHVVHQAGAQHLVQRSALFDVCLASGLAHLIVAYVRAEESSSSNNSSNTSHGRTELGLAPPNYVLKEPIAVQQWVRRRVESTERRVNEIVADDHFHGGHASGQEPTQRELEASIRELSGLRAIAMALVERLHDGSHHVTQRALSSHHTTGHTHASDHSHSLDDTELAGLTRAGSANLLELLARIQTLAMACRCMLWLEEHHVVVDESAYGAFYASARASRATYWDQFVENYGAAVSSTSTGGDRAEPMLLIERVMESAGVSVSAIGGSCPPRQLSHLLALVRSPSIVDDVVAYYGAALEREPIESFFRVQSALLLYFCLDRAYVSLLASQVHTGVRIAHKMRALADSCAAELDVRDDMKLTLLALWLIENAATVNTGNHDHVTALYDSAIALLQQSSALHVHQTFEVESDLVLHIVETLVHRGESVAAWKVWHAFAIDVTTSAASATAVELAVVIALELDVWERALTLLRAHARTDLLELVLSALVKTNRVKELVQSATLLPAEERVFRQFMLNAGLFADADALKDENIRRADLLTMYYVVRSQYAAAWRVHHEHLAMIRDATAGDTHIAATVLNQPSFRARVALLESMCAEPRPTASAAPPARALERRSSNADDVDDDDAMDADIDQSHKQPMLLPSTQLLEAMSSARDAPSYSPGIYSSRASLARSSSSKKLSPNDSVEAPQGAVASASRKAVQSLNFGSAPATASGHGAQAFALGTTASPSTATTDGAFSGRSSVVNQPPRSRFNSSFHGATPATNPGGVSTDDLTLKPRTFDSVVDPSVALPVDVHVASRRSVLLDTASVPLSSTSSTHSSEALLETPKRFQFVREPMTDSRIGTSSSSVRRDVVKSPASAELEDMELERIDEEFSTPLSRSRGRRTEAASVPERRNPRRSARTKY